MKTSNGFMYKKGRIGLNRSGLIAMSNNAVRSQEGEDYL